MSFFQVRSRRFKNNKVDAWVTWEPFLTSVQRQLPTRTLADGAGLACLQLGEQQRIADIFFASGLLPED